MFRQQTGHQQLIIIGLPKVQPQAATIRQLHRREHRRLAHLLAILFSRRHLIKFRFTHIQALHLLRNFITTRANRRSYARVDILGPATKLFAHRLHRGQRNTARRAAPSPVRHPYSPLHRIIKQHRGAISERKRQRHPPLSRNQRVRLPSRFDRPHQLFLSHPIRAVWPIIPPVIPHDALRIERRNLRAVYLPQCRARISLYP